MSVKPIAVNVAQIHWRDSLDHVLGNGPADATTVGEPHGFRKPESFQVGRLSQQRIPIRRECKDSVDAVGEFNFLERRKKLDGVSQRVLEMLGSEGPECGSGSAGTYLVQILDG